MTGTAFLAWVRDSGFEIATAIFVLGILIRLLEVIWLGRSKTLAEPRAGGMLPGLRTILTRSWPETGTLQRSTFTIIAGYVFHIGLFITLFLFVPHIVLVEEAFGASWPGLPTPMVDAVSVLTIASLLFVLGYRLWNPVLRFLSGVEDYLVWSVTLLPILTGYLAFHRVLLPSPWMLGLHILSVEILMVVFPFSKLMHTFTLFIARWFNGAEAGVKGVRS